MARAEDDYVAGHGANAGMPLRPTDPQRLGPYALLRRLGEGGMGSVYLAEADDGQVVALKVIRADLAAEPEFRRRFRSEVLRAQQVPPFCTAEVLDADADHETPYLVVEYVDGPSLADVVADRGPLTPANLHGLAIGVATALTAIHGAGVIHRDLKPSNVMLAPGTPKVIDFGIARATEGSDGETRTDQLMGTVAYMAPERLDPTFDDTLTPAADIFAWGAIVTYAATGHVPFVADSSPATAVAILTQKPNLDGVAEPLRRLVRRSLAKRPQSRPTARQLLDELLSDASYRSVVGARNGVGAQDRAGAPAEACVDGGAGADGGAGVECGAGVGGAGVGGGNRVPDGGGTAAVADDHMADADAKALTSGLAHALVDVEADTTTSEPETIAAASANSAGARGSGATGTGGPGASPAGASPAGASPEGTGTVATRVRPAVVAPGDLAPARVLSGDDRVVPRGSPVAASAGDPTVTIDRPRSPWRRVGIAALVFVVVASAGALAGTLTGVIKPLSRAAPSATPGRSTPAIVAPPVASTPPSASAAPPSATPSTSPSTPLPSQRSSSLPSGPGATGPFPFAAIQDPLVAENFWHASARGEFFAGCAFTDAGLDVTLSEIGNTRTYRCTGPRQPFGDFRLSVTVSLDSPGSCGAVWFRLDPNFGGYALRVCADRIDLGVHVGSTLTVLKRAMLATPLGAGDKIRVSVMAMGDIFTIDRCGQLTATGCEDAKVLGHASDARFTDANEISVGIFEPDAADATQSYGVTFSNIEIDTATPMSPAP